MEDKNQQEQKLFSYQNIHQKLLQQQSIDFPRYGKMDEGDFLIELISQEIIVDYTQVEWKAFWKRFYKEKDYSFLPGKDNHYKIKFGDELLQFCDKIIGKAETVRLLTYFRDHASESVFEGDTVDNIAEFEKECSRLIYVYTNERVPDRYSGSFASMAHPNLQHIALGESAQPKIITEEDRIIAANIPLCKQCNNAFPPAVIIYVARKFVKHFRDSKQSFSLLRIDENKPIMKPQAYKDSIRDELITTTDRLLYFNDDPIYQVMWVMAILMRLPRQQEWWEDHMAQNLMNYLDCTQHFAKTKKIMDKTISQIRNLTEPTLGFFEEEEIAPTQEHKAICTTTSTAAQMKQLWEDLTKNQDVNRISDFKIICNQYYLYDNSQYIDNKQNINITGNG